MRQKTYEEMQRDRQRGWDDNRRELLEMKRAAEFVALDSGWNFPWRLIPVIGLIGTLIVWLLLGGGGC